MEYERRHKEAHPVLAICYDFDKTLSPDDMQAQGHIQSMGYGVSQFWSEPNQMAVDNDMDNNLAYMYKMVQESEGKIIFNREKLAEYGSHVKLYRGAAEWLERIRRTLARSTLFVSPSCVFSTGILPRISCRPSKRMTM